MAMRGPRVPVGSSTWIADERSSALNIAQSEAEEFSYSVRNDFDWLNEHMAEVFNENEINVAEIFKTPGKLRGKTPRTARKVNNGEQRVPLSDVFSSASKANQTPFTQQLSRLQSPKPQTSRSPLANKTASPFKPLHDAKPQPSKQPTIPADSGYYGSQSQDVMDVDQAVQETQSTQPASPTRYADISDHVSFHPTPEAPPASPTVNKTIHSPTRTFQTAKEEQTAHAMRDGTQSFTSPRPSATPAGSPHKNNHGYPIISTTPHVANMSSPKKSSPLKSSPAKHTEQEEHNPANDPSDDAEDQSDGSSPIRPVVRKSSLNFASLPAREPLTSKKSMGPPHSRPSHDNRTSYYGRHTGGKSLGQANARHDDSDEDDDFNDAMDVDEMTTTTQDPTRVNGFADNHNKMYTQKLQDQINLLGKSQPNATRPSKSISSSAAAQRLSQGGSSQPAQQEKETPATPNKSPSKSPARKQPNPPTPGAFPEDDDEDDWIAPPKVPEKDTVSSPRPTLPKSHTADIMEGIHDADTVGAADFVLPKQRQPDSRSTSPQRPQTAAPTPGHGKSASVSVLPDHGARPATSGAASPSKPISVSNPALTSVAESSESDRPGTPPKSPSRSFRDSPLKQVKNKLSSIIKSSRGLLASSAALSAEGKTSMMSPSTTRLGYHMDPSTDTLAQQAIPAEPTYPDLSQQVTGNAPSISNTGSPSRPVSKRTRASIEREKEEKRKEKEAEKEARFQAEQADKLEKARVKEREKAHVFSKEQDKTSVMEKKVASQREQEKPTHATRTPAPKETARPTRTSPRKAKVPASAKAVAEDDVDMMDAPPSVPPPSATRSAGPSQATRGKEIRRPVKPSKETAAKAKQAPTVIRVNTGSQHSQYHPTNNALSSNLRDTLGANQSQQQLKSKASQASLQNKPSLQSLKSSTSSSGRPKALELAAKRKEQEEREAQRKRDVKLETERKRAALQEEERKKEQQRREEAERQKEKERQQTDAKKNAQRQAAIERAKQTRAPPPAVRSQPNGPPDCATEDAATGGSQRADGPPRPPSRLTTNNQRPQEDSGRPVSAVLSQGAKAQKRTLPDAGDNASRNPQARNGPSYQAKDAKRRRTSDDFFDELDMESQQQPNIKGPPVRPSGGLKRDVPAKSMYTSGYTAAPQPPSSASRDLFKATVTAQHNSAVKTTQPVDMSQFSKGAIPFAPNPNPAGPHKTPVRPPTAGAAQKSTAKSAQRSSPRFQNGESIELPEIDTDDEDEEEDESGGAVAAWADSPELRRALMHQESMDPGAIFGPPTQLNMEEVFSKSKDKWHKFRARTSSANWSGADRLTEDDIRKDMAAREKLRREGAWSYEMSRDLM